MIRNFLILICCLLSQSSHLTRWSLRRTSLPGGNLQVGWKRSEQFQAHRFASFISPDSDVDQLSVQCMFDSSAISAESSRRHERANFVKNFVSTHSQPQTSYNLIKSNHSTLTTKLFHDTRNLHDRDLMSNRSGQNRGGKGAYAELSHL